MYNNQDRLERLRPGIGCGVGLKGERQTWIPAYTRRKVSIIGVRSLPIYVFFHLMVGVLRLRFINFLSFLPFPVPFSWQKHPDTRWDATLVRNSQKELER